MTAYRRRLYRITASALVGAMGITGIAATASVASPSSVGSSVSSSTSASVGAPAASVSAFAASSPVAVQVPGSSAPSAVGGSATTLGAGSAIIKVIKAIPKLWNAAVEKVKAGYRAFKSWWENSVPQWIKNLMTGVTIYDIYQEIRNLIGL